MAVRGRKTDRLGGYSCSLSAHDQNVLGQCAQLDTRLFVLQMVGKKEMNKRS